MARLFPIIIMAALAAAISPANAAGYAPLDCGKASSSSEKAICSDYELGQFEARVATLFEITTSLVAMGQRGNIQDEQRAFLTQREACRADVACLKNAYRTRIRQLEAVMTGIASHGPF